MRFNIRHATQYRYGTPGSCAVQRLRLTPRDNRAQTVSEWHIETPGIEHAATYTDGFGNLVHLVTHQASYDTMSVVASGEVQTRDTGGVLGDLPESASPMLFMRRTPLTESSAGIDAMADRMPATSTLSCLHHLLEAIATQVAYVQNSTHSGTNAAEAFSAGAGVCQDHAHIFIAASRRLGIPARYVTGYLHIESKGPAAANHAWAEAYIGGLGWVGFDPANNICPTERYIRLACGFDAKAASPIVGTRRGGGSERLTVDVMVEQKQQ